MAIKPIKVSQLNNYIKRVLQTDPLLGNVSVIGEISNLKYHSTGIYFSLKDQSSKINCYISPDVSSRLRYQLAEGMEIIAYGYINLYERGGTYSINIKDIDMQGAGNLAIAFEKLKAKLQSEGLFSEAHKKPLPFFPKKIAVITSPTGAAVSDIKKIITGKNNIVDILIYPVLVQGTAAASDISSAIENVNNMQNPPDVIIVGRGGGSMEELWAFNEEIVARSIFASKIPIISAVGHETDFTISDFVADKRAETPTAAAAMAAPDIAQIKAFCENQRELLYSNLKRNVELKEAKLQAMNIESLKKRLEDRMALSELKIKSLKESIEALNPQNIINRGYAKITDDKGNLITSIKDVKNDNIIHSILKDGILISKVIKIEEEVTNE